MIYTQTQVRERLDAARKAETARIEERKNSHIERLMKAHEKAFAEIKNYYNDITHNNLDLIRSLKEEVGAIGVEWNVSLPPPFFVWAFQHCRN